MNGSVGLYKVCVDSKPRAKFTQLSTVCSYQVYLKRKGYKDVGITHEDIGMSTCRINGRQYVVDFDNYKFYSMATAKMYIFSPDTKISEIKECLMKFDV